MNRRLAAFACLAFVPAIVMSLLITLEHTGSASQPAQGHGEGIGQAAADGPLEPTRAHSVVAREVAARLQNGHYRDQRIDDALSARILQRYLSYLDPRRSVFLASDVLEFGKWETELDDAILSGELDPAFAIFRRYLERLEAQMIFLQARLETDLDAIDFEDGDEIQIDRSEAPWPRDKAELEELWRLRMDGEILSLKLAGSEMDKIKEVLERRYASQMRFSERFSADDVNQLFLNALASCYDAHTQYLGRKSAEDFNIDMSLSVEGIGALLGNDGEYVVIQRVIPGGPAEKSERLAPEDRIVSVAQGDEDPVDVIGWRTDEVAELVRGPAGSVVRVAVLKADLPEGSPPRTITMERESVALEERAATSQVIEVTFPGAEPGPARRFGVIELPDFYMDFEGYRNGDPDFRSTTRDVAKELEKLKQEGVEGVILDLRNNGGGSLVEVTELGGLFVGQRPIVQYRGIDPDEPPNVFSAHVDTIYDGPLMVLINRSSASASEIFAGAMQDYGRGLVVGERSFGKGTVQGILPVSAGDLFLTEAKFYRITGESTQLRGVVPDIRFPDGFDETEYGESSMDDVLPWDEIMPAVRVKKEGPLKGTTEGRRDVLALVPELARRHEARVTMDPEFLRAHARLTYYEELGSDEYLSIDESVRRAEQEEHEARLVAIENEYREATGQPLIESLDDLADEDDEEGDDDAEEEEAPEEPDPFHVEAARILADYAEMIAPR